MPKKTISMRVQITDEDYRLDDEETAKFVATTLSDGYLGAKVSVSVGRWVLAEKASLTARVFPGGK